MRLATGRSKFKTRTFIDSSFKYAGFHSIFFIGKAFCNSFDSNDRYDFKSPKDKNYATTLVKHNMNDMEWVPGDPSDDFLVLRLDTGTISLHFKTPSDCIAYPKKARILLFSLPKSNAWPRHG